MESNHVEFMQVLDTLCCKKLFDRGNISSKCETKRFDKSCMKTMLSS